MSAESRPGRNRSGGQFQDINLEWRLDKGTVVSAPVSHTPPVDPAPAHPSRTWIALDFETANEQRASVCAVGVARVQDGQVVERRSWLVRPPEMRFNSINISIHGITAEDVVDAPLFDELWPEIEPILTAGTVIAHNAGFDMSVLRHTLEAYGVPFPPIRYLCTVTLARAAWPTLPNHKLNTVSAHLGLSLNHHDAEEDAVACAGVSLHCCKAYGVTTLDDLADKLGIRHGALHKSGYTPPRKLSRARRRGRESVR
jgi:DNA polymerase-3 subunit epsilon